MTTKVSDIKFAQNVRVLGILANIRAKLKNLDYFVITVSSLSHMKTFRNVFGFPNRHLELEWGVWQGTLTEFVIPMNTIDIR